MAQAFYSPVTVQNGQVPSTQTDFPVLVSYTDNRLRTIGNGGHVANANGYDIRPYSDSSLATALTFELESYNASTGETIMWVKVPSLADGYVIYLGYGDSALNSNGSSSSTWDANYKSVWHLPDGSTLNTNDSTSNTNTGTSHGTVTAVTGKIDGAMNSATQFDYIIGANLLNTTSATVSAWVKINTLPPSSTGFIAGFMDGWDSAVYDKNMTVDTTGHAIYFIYDGATKTATGATALSTGTWYYLVGTNDGTNVKIYVNGSQDASTAAGNSYTGYSVPNMFLGGRPTGSIELDSSKDEFRISNIARSANWITTEYNNQNAPSTFAALGTETAVGGGGGPAAANSLNFFMLLGLGT